MGLIKTFVSLVEHGSFVELANHTGQSPSTVSKAISRLETELGVRLFHRTTRKLQLSEAGENYLVTAKAVLETLSAGEEQLIYRNNTPRGSLKVCVPNDFGQLYVLPIISQFIEKYPDIELDIRFSDQHSDLVVEKLDIVIRTGKLEDSRLVAKKLSPIEMGIFASPTWIARNGIPSSADELIQHRWVGYKFQQTGRRLDVNYVEDGQPIVLPIENAVVVNSGVAMLELAVQGVGLVYLPHFIAREKVKHSELVLIGEPWRYADQGVYLYYLSREHLPNKVRVFIDFLSQYYESINEDPKRTWLTDAS